MDPLTQALALARTIAEIIKITIEAMPPETRAEFGRLHVEQMQRWQGLDARSHQVRHDVEPRGRDVVGREVEPRALGHRTSPMQGMRGESVLEGP